MSNKQTGDCRRGIHDWRIARTICGERFFCIRCQMEDPSEERPAL